MKLVDVVEVKVEQITHYAYYDLDKSDFRVARISHDIQETASEICSELYSKVSSWTEINDKKVRSYRCFDMPL